MTPEARRFPIGLTLAAAAVFVVCTGLGVWQLQRAAWKQEMLAKIAALQSAPPQPIAPVLGRAARGEDVAFTRVEAACAPAPPGPAEVRMTTDRGDWIGRILSPCRLAMGPYDGVIVDRGLLISTRGDTNPPLVSLPAPGVVTGVLFPSRGAHAAGLLHPATYLLVAEHETPARGGLTPAPYASNAPEKLQYVGAYAATWFGLAGVVLCVYAAMLWRGRRPEPVNPKA
jgi:surfeit locus 1 family protein